MGLGTFLCADVQRDPLVALHNIVFVAGVANIIYMYNMLFVAGVVWRGVFLD
jgi:hypothetical protein